MCIRDSLDNIPKEVQFNEPQFESKFLIISAAYLLAFMFGLLEVIRDNAAQAFLPQIVSKDNLPKANGRLFGIEIVTNNFLGTPVGGFLIGFSLITPFIFDTLLMLVSVFFITGIKGKFERPEDINNCLLYTSPSPRDLSTSRMPSSA